MWTVILPLLTKRWFWEVLVVVVLVMSLIHQVHSASALREQLAASNTDQTVKELNARLESKAHAYGIIEADLAKAKETVVVWAKAFEHLQSQRPNVKEVRIYVESKTKTDAGLLAEARRVLGPAGDSVRVASVCR